MGETAVSSRSVRRLPRLVEEQVNDPAKVVNAEDETKEAAERRASKRGQSVTSSKRKGKQAKEEVVTRELMGTDVVDAVSLELGSLELNDDCNGNSRSSGIVLNAVPQEFVANMERSLSRGDDAAGASSSGHGDEDDSVMDLESAAEQGVTSNALSRRDPALLAELMQEIRKGGDWTKLKKCHMQAYLRHHGLRISDGKDVLVGRIRQHLKMKEGQAQDIHPRSSFTINCKGDACRGDTVFFSQTVFDIANRPRLGARWVAGEVVHESYGAELQQHTFTIEVLWSTGMKPLRFMEQLQIKGRKLYDNYTWRQPWIDEEAREQELIEKHKRGENARATRRDNEKRKRGEKARDTRRENFLRCREDQANSSCSMPMQSSIQQDFQQKVYLGNSNVVASSHLPHLL